MSVAIAIRNSSTRQKIRPGTPNAVLPTSRSAAELVVKSEKHDQIVVEAGAAAGTTHREEEDAPPAAVPVPSGSRLRQPVLNVVVRPPSRSSQGAIARCIAAIASVRKDDEQVGDPCSAGRVPALAGQTFFFQAFVHGNLAGGFSNGVITRVCPWRIIRMKHMKSRLFEGTGSS